MNTIAKYLADLIHAQLEQTLPPPIPPELDITQLMELSNSNHINYLIMGALLKAPNLPEDYKAPLSLCVFKSLQRTLNQVNELKHLVQICEEKHIRNQPMKGSCMKFIYPTPEAREMSDIDILVDQDRLNEIGKILIEDGYTLQQSVRQHDVYVKPPFMVVEAHRTMYDKTVDKNQFDYFSSFSKTYLREGHSYTYDYTPEDFYVYMMAHMAKHFYARGCGIRNIVDVYIYLKEYQDTLNWDYVNKELETCGILDFTRHIEKLSRIWLGGEPGEPFYDNLFEYMLYAGIYGKDENGVWSRFADAKLQGKDVSAQTLKKWYYFPPLAYMAELYPWVENHNWLLPVAWVVRGFHGIVMKKGARKQEMLHDIHDGEISVYRDIYSKMGLHFKK